MSEKRWYWMSSEKMTVGVGVVDGIIRRAAPIVYKFRGQPLENLERWMRGHGGFEMEEMTLPAALETNK